MFHRLLLALALAGAALAGEPGHSCCPTFAPEVQAQLDEALARPDAAETRTFALVVIVDGGQADKLRSLATRGKLPRIQEHLIDRGLSCFDAVTVWPSTSVPAHTSIVTGRFPRAHGILFPKWLDRATRHYRDYIGLQITKLGADMHPGTRTLFEQLAPWRSASAMEICHRGAGWFLPGTPHDALAARLSIGVQRFVRPQLLVVSLPGVDHHTHGVDMDSAESDKAYTEMDRHFGNIVAALKARGIYDRTVIALTSDHGMGPVHTHVPIHRMLAARGLRVLPSRRQTTLGPVGGVFGVASHDAVVMWGGNSEVALHLRGPGGSWAVRPEAATLCDLTTWLLAQPGIELALSRDAGGAVLVRGARGTGRIEVTGAGPASARRYAYRVTGDDPLGYLGDPAVAPLCDGTPHDAESWLEATARHRYPDAPVRLANHLGGARDADLYLIASRGYDFMPPELAGMKKRIAGTHGHLNREQSAVPFLIAGPGIPRGALPHARTVDLVPTLLQALDRPVEAHLTDGISRLGR